MSKEKMVTITQEEYEQLLDKKRKLDALECCGVDNWGGWDDAMEIYHSEDEE